MSSVADNTGWLTADARARGWSRALPALAIAALAAGWPLADSVAQLLDLWINNHSYGHGLLVVPVMLYLLWIKRHDFLDEAPRPAAAGVAALGALMLLWLAARLLAVFKKRTHFACSNEIGQSAE